jgi:hypothetical protein
VKGGDPTIPRHPADARGQRIFQVGKIVERGGKLFLVADDGPSWSVEYVTVLQGIFGWTEDGVAAFPRPWVYDDTGKATLEGDKVVFSRLNGAARMPLIVGAVRSNAPHPFLSATISKAPRNRIAFRKRALDAQGKQKGEVRAEINPAEDGEMRVAATTRLQLQVAPTIDDANAGLQVVMEGGQVEITNGSTAEAMIRGETFLSDLKTYNEATTTLVTACSTATSAAQLAAAFATYLPQHLAWAAKVAASVTGSGAPHLSTVLKSQ